jgi:hypothetical protein
LVVRQIPKSGFADAAKSFSVRHGLWNVSRYCERLSSIVSIYVLLSSPNTVEADSSFAFGPHQLLAVKQFLKPEEKDTRGNRRLDLAIDQRVDRDQQGTCEKSLTQ